MCLSTEICRAEKARLDQLEKARIERMSSQVSHTSGRRLCRLPSIVYIPAVCICVDKVHYLRCTLVSWLVCLFTLLFVCASEPS